MPHLLGILLAACALLLCSQPVFADDGGEEASASGISPGVSRRTRQQWDPSAYEPSSEWSGPKYVSEGEAKGASLGRKAEGYRNGVIASGVVMGFGVAFIAGGAVAARNHSRDPDPDSFIPIGAYTCVTLGAVMSFGGLIGMAVAGSKLHDHKHRRAAWDFQKGAWVF